jgi:protein-S-isoprenylcysteine O-methyltransferase Ste14
MQSIAGSRLRGRGDMTGFLARRRVTIGFACGLLAIVLARPTRASLLVGLPIVIAGEAIRLWAAGHLEKGREVTSSGPYRWTRHPLYVGSTLLGLGFAAAANHVAVLALAVAYLALTLTAAARSEERHLDAKFGDVYDRYRRGEAATVSRRYSFSRARRNGEHRTVIGVAAAAVLLMLMAR